MQRITISFINVKSIKGQENEWREYDRVKVKIGYIRTNASREKNI